MIDYNLRTNKTKLKVNYLLKNNEEDIIDFITVRLSIMKL